VVDWGWCGGWGMVWWMGNGVVDGEWCCGPWMWNGVVDGLGDTGETSTNIVSVVY